MSEFDPHLLIIDDDERIRTLLQKFLNRNGFLVTAARDAAHARPRLVRFALETGADRGEVLALNWNQHIDRDR